MVDGKYIPPPPSTPLPPTPGENIYAELGEHGGLVDNTGYLRPHHSNNEGYLVPQDPHYNGLQGRGPSQNDYQKLNGEKFSGHQQGIDNPSYEHMDENQNNVPVKRQMRQMSQMRQPQSWIRTVRIERILKASKIMKMLSVLKM